MKTLWIASSESKNAIEEFVSIGEELDESSSIMVLVDSPEHQLDGEFIFLRVEKHNCGAFGMSVAVDDERYWESHMFGCPSHQRPEFGDSSLAEFTTLDWDLKDRRIFLEGKTSNGEPIEVCVNGESILVTSLEKSWSSSTHAPSHYEALGRGLVKAGLMKSFEDSTGTIWFQDRMAFRLSDGSISE